MQSGWIKLHRDIKHHWVFQRDDYLKAWLFLILRANHKDNKTLFSDVLPEIIEIKRGDVVSSLQKLGYELKWSPSKVRRFLKKLQKDNMITIHNEKRWTHLSINNYDTYQDVRHGDETPATRERIIGENNIRMNKNEKNEKKSLSKEEQLKKIKDNIKELKKKFPNVNVQFEFDKMSDWLLSSGKRYKNYNAFFNNWLRKAQENSAAGSEEVSSYVYKCNTCNKEGTKSEYRDLYITCCNEQMIAYKEG
jgi:DNA-binding transcriptional regulator YhcF (GntR family)